MLEVVGYVRDCVQWMEGVVMVVVVGCVLTMCDDH